LHTITTVIYYNLFFLIIGNTNLIYFIIGHIYLIVILLFITYLQIYLLTYIIILSKKNKDGSILTIHKYGFSAYQLLCNLTFMSSHCNMKRLIGSNVSTHITKIKKNIVPIRYSSIIYNTYIINTHSYQGFIIITNNTICQETLNRRKKSKRKIAKRC